ncbi:bleomycin resistance protein [Novosphingobium umbonatum]|uniref:Bleomycin resistance protein n=1 Tax=Novosphingobium umbonatum TaxID=1908524 RepID=A0A3S2USV8_9SPHN|nr:VOC family protein [Novosphingobium umbonatum]RVU05421.1 bleomycin resistance protein [Novosphingobium umbonatum]
MSILGVESVLFGVDDVAENARFWTDFGLPVESISESEAVFRLASGSRLIVLPHGDPRLPSPDPFAGNGVKETVWGVDTAENLDRIAASLASEVAVTRDADGTVHCTCPDGQPIALRVWAKRPFHSEASPVNTPASYPRFNQHRIWRQKAIPKTINHVVFFSPDYVGSFEFYERHLGFRYVDHSKGVGIFARAGGTFEHHSIFWVNCDLPFAPDTFKFMHIAFGMDDIDEVMLGANLMAEKGWKNESMNSSGGISRHRISSAIYYYCDIPGKGGEAEYHADTDYLDDNWVPRAWDFRFGSLLWSNNAPPIFRGPDIPWDMQFDADRKSFEPYRKAKAGKVPVLGKLAEISEEDEHAI